MFVAQMLTRTRERLITIDVTASLEDVADLMARPHVDLVVACSSDGKMAGVLSKTDIVGVVRQSISSGRSVRVEDIMAEDVISCTPGQPLQAVWDLMRQRGLQRIPVLDEDAKPIGIVYARDALQSLLNASECEESLLRDYVMNVGYQ